MRLAVKVVPGASRDAIVGWLDRELKVAVSVPPERGRANDAVAALLRHALGVSVELIRGQTSARKTFDVPELDEAQARERLDRHVAASSTRR
jgi:uncharacterized protein (TIGR00251 family)